MPDCTEPHLGLATTLELVQELSIRIQMGHGYPTYRTVDEAPQPAAAHWQMKLAERDGGVNPS